ncbi:hypothetical protein PFICI_04197 [Pestalotiopsis fici W106-1]|uniref:Hcy-binding domain-containing protein n=1 Tax=Pestalotiopsis fici (strain W106-1 / CGMCC3.15140) TaxID=1229662 RepID=W3XL20_PESFW|nr:uncharacterized protein PFICI_04197 [Pestalotiopsis fici W106-1]ETS86172.1 hypothetical protein PFICI_04197 [Pestalotiopsis fici W106-1]
MASIRILDGGLGTSLEDKYGVKFNHSMPLWSTHFLVQGEETLLACQADFVTAGADVLLTATYQTSIEGFQRTRTADHPDGISKEYIGGYMSKAVAIAEKAVRDSDSKIALSLGPYGACMIPGQEYTGNYDDDHDSEESLYSWHLERLQLFTVVPGLIERISYIALETIPRLDEFRAARRAVQDSGIKAPFWMAGVFPGEGDTLPDGSSIVQVVEAMVDPATRGARPWGIGINCTKLHKLPSLIESFESAVKELIESGRLERSPAMVVYPDGTNGEVYNTTTKTWEKPQGQEHKDIANADSWASQLANVIRTSSTRGCFQSYLVGGCCKASAVDIGDLKREFASQGST